MQPAQPAVKAKKDERKNAGAGGGEEPLPGPPRKRSVKERLGVMPGITTSAGIKVKTVLIIT